MSVHGADHIDVFARERCWSPARYGIEITPYRRRDKTLEKFEAQRRTAGSRGVSPTDLPPVPPYLGADLDAERRTDRVRFSRKTMISPPAAPPTTPTLCAAAPLGAGEGTGIRARLRRFAVASLLGAAVVVWPAWPTAAQERSARRPAFERALSWRDFIRLRLSPWLLMQNAQQPDEWDPPHPPAR